MQQSLQSFPARQPFLLEGGQAAGLIPQLLKLLLGIKDRFELLGATLLAQLLQDGGAHWRGQRGLSTGLENLVLKGIEELDGLGFFLP